MYIVQLLLRWNYFTKKITSLLVHWQQNSNLITVIVINISHFIYSKRKTS